MQYFYYCLSNLLLRTKLEGVGEQLASQHARILASQKTEGSDLESERLVEQQLRIKQVGFILYIIYSFSFVSNGGILDMNWWLELRLAAFLDTSSDWQHF